VGRPPEKEARPATATVERGPVTVTLTAERGEFSIADTLKLTCTVEAEQAVEIEMPQFGESLGEFLVKDFREYGPDVTAENKNRRRQEYELEVYTSGEYKIPPLTVKFLDRRKGSAAQKKDAETKPKWNELKTEELTVKATSVVEDSEELTAINDIIGPVSLPRASFLKRHGTALGIAAGAAVAIAVALFLLLRKRRAEKQMLPAHVIAFRMLEWLIAQDFVSRGLLEEFYVHLCNVVRKYIEIRFGIHAPEETTEEFLAELSSPDPGEGRLPLGEHRALLKDFLEHADLVKFARHTPGDDEIQRSFDSAKGFIRATSDESLLVEAVSAGGEGV